MTEMRPQFGFRQRELDHYPQTGTRRAYLALVVLITVALYYALYIGGGVAPLFMRELHVRAPDDAPKNPWRSVPLAERAHDFERRLADLRLDVDTASASELFELACSAPPRDEPTVWLHGDLHPGNLIFRDGHLVGVVDFGDICAGDPATDLAGALLTLPYASLETFLAAYGDVVDATYARTIGWAVVLGSMMVGLGRARPRYMKVGRRALENAARLSTWLG